jgi:hypothetical protein
MSSSRRRRREHPLGEIGRAPDIAPYHACIRCWKGDTERGFVVQGDAEFVAASLHVYAELDQDEALRIAEHIFVEQGTPLDARDRVSFIRLCRGCAKKTGVRVHSVSALVEGGEFPGLMQPDD